MQTQEVDYTVPPMMAAPPSKPKRGLLISTIALAVALLLGLVAGGFVLTGVQADLDLSQASLAAARGNLEEAEATVASTEAELGDAEAKASACANAADLLAKGANGYANLWNEADDAADRWNIIYAFYLRAIMRKTNVPNATLSAGWDALDLCEAGGTEAL